MGKGWISLNRSIRDHWLYLEKRKFSYYEAWIDILMDANHADNKFLMNGELIIVERGSYITSIRKLEEKWGWSDSKVVKFFDLLEADGMAIRKSDTKKTLITVLNYDYYQKMDMEKRRVGDNEPTEKQNKSDTEAKQKRTNNNVNNENNDKQCKQDNIVEQVTDAISTEMYREIIDYLNQKAGTSYRATSKATQTKIKARLGEGFTVDNFKKVIDNKTSEWLDDPKMQKFLRPNTLFGPKFEGYLNQVPYSTRSNSYDNGVDYSVPEEFRVVVPNDLNMDDLPF